MTFEKAVRTYASHHIPSENAALTLPHADLTPTAWKIEGGRSTYQLAAGPLWAIMFAAGGFSGKKSSHMYVDVES